MKPYYQENGIEIYQGDSRNILPTLDTFDLVLTDPPYGIREADGKNKYRLSKDKSRGNSATPKDYGDDDWDHKQIEQPLINSLIAKGKFMIMFGGNFYAMPPSSCWLIWDKNNSGDFADAELAWTNLKKAVRLFKYTWNGMLQENMRHKEFRYHPTQKPLALMQWCIQQAPPTVKTILDPFMGSGTTLLAAKNLGRHCVGIEKEEKYCEIAVKRLQQEVLPFKEVQKCEQLTL